MSSVPVRHGFRAEEDETVLVLAPFGRDASLACAFLGSRGIAAKAFPDMAALCGALREVPGMVLVTQEALSDGARRQLATALRARPAASDLPVLVLTVASNAARPDPQVLRILAGIDNVTLVPRPVHATTLLGMVRSALGARRHRHERRDRGKAAEGNAAAGGFRALVDGQPLATFVVAEGNVAYANARAITLLGADAAQIVGQPVCRWVHEDFVPALRQCVTGLLDTRQPAIALEQKWLCGGAPVDVDVQVAPVRWQGSGAVMMLVRDITQAVQDRAAVCRKAEELARADQRKNEFIALLAHELRNPLAPIHNAVHVLKIQPDPPDAGHYRWATDVINRQVHHITRLADDLLDMARATHGRIKLQKEALDLGNVLAQSIESVRPLTGARKQSVAYSPPAAPIRLEADPVRLAQIVGNLLANASRYTPPGGHIDLSARREEAEAVIVVSDDGIGIPPQALSEIFQPFRQAQRPLDYAQAGLGLGLALVDRLVALHGGSVQAYSEGAGRGSVFTVRLPALRAAQAELEEATAASSAPARNLRILVVDDDPDVAQSFAVLLSLMGHNVQATHGAVAALAATRGFDPHIVFLDISPPDMDAIVLADALRRTSPRADLRLVALIDGAPEDVPAHLAARFAAHLVKPVAASAVEKLFVSFRAEAGGCSV